MPACPEGGVSRAQPRRIDWRKAAELLAHGRADGEVAADVGCSRRHLARKRRHDAVFRGWIEELRQAARERARIGDLRSVVQQAIEAEVRNGNVRVILWLADRLKLITPPSERTPEQELRELLGGLSTAELREFESLRDNAS